MVEARHLLHDLARERAALGGDADDARGLQGVNGGEEVGDGRMVVRVGLLVLGQVGSAADDQAARVHEPASPAGIGLRQPFGHHRGHGEVRDARGGFAGAQEQEPLILQGAARHAERREQARQRHRGRALDVVVEGGDLVLIFPQQAERVLVGEVLELDDDAGEDALGGGHELVHQRVVVRARQAPLVQPDVERIVQQRLVVGAHVEHHRQALGGLDAGRRRVERQLPDGDGHAVGAQVPEPEDPLAVGDDDHPHAGLGPVAQGRLDAAAVGGADEHAARALEDVRVLLARQSHRRRVDDGHFRPP
jgi:hypothetical protein